MDLILPKEVAQKTNGALRIIEWLDGRYKNVWGRPDFDDKSSKFWEMVFDIIKVWEKLWPRELEDWLHDRKIDLAVEKSISELSKSKLGLKKSMAYPPHLFQLLHAYWPQGKFADKEFTHHFKSRFPMFNNSNYT